jgi:hypothetical protein
MSELPRHTFANDRLDPIHLEQIENWLLALKSTHSRLSTDDHESNGTAISADSHQFNWFVLPLINSSLLALWEPGELSRYSRGKMFFSTPQRLDRALGPTQSPIEWIPGPLSQGYSGRHVKLTTHLYLVPRSRIMELHLHSPIHLNGVVFN